MSKKNNVSTFFSVAIDLIILKLADKEEMHNILHVFEFCQIGRQKIESATLDHPNKYPYCQYWIIMGEMVSKVFLGCLLENYTIYIYFTHFT